MSKRKRPAPSDGETQARSAKVAKRSKTQRGNKAEEVPTRRSRRLSENEDEGTEKAQKQQKMKVSARQLVQKPVNVKPGGQRPRPKKTPTARSAEIDNLEMPKTSDIGEVQEVGEGEYEFEFPIRQLETFHRLAWVVSHTTTSILVRVAFLRLNDTDVRGFCVHLVPDQQLPKSRHAYCLTSQPWDDSMVCGSHFNFLTYVLSGNLYDLLSRESVDLQEIYDMILELIQSDPGIRCIVCDRLLKVKLWRPSACSEACTKVMESWPLDVRLSPLLLDHHVLDFLLCCSYTSILLRERYPDLIPAIPGTREAIDAFPKLIGGMTARDLLKGGKFRAMRKTLLSWLCNTFTGCLVSAANKAQVEIDKTTSLLHQFLLLNAKATYQKSFVARLASKAAGSPAFHGTPAGNVINILSDQLHIRNGGIWYAGNPQYSFGYFQRWMPKSGDLKPWKHSQFPSCFVLFGVEISGDRHPKPTGESSAREQRDVMVRYVFLVPRSMVNGGNYTARQVNDITPVMRQAFKRIHRDELGSVCADNVEGKDTRAEPAKTKSKA